MCLAGSLFDLASPLLVVLLHYSSYCAEILMMNGWRDDLIIVVGVDNGHAAIMVAATRGSIALPVCCAFARAPTRCALPARLPPVPSLRAPLPHYTAPARCPARTQLPHHTPLFCQLVIFYGLQLCLLSRWYWRCSICCIPEYCVDDGGVLLFYT